MKFKATTIELKKALQKLGNAVNAKSVIPATAYIKAEVGPQVVCLSATDLQTSISYFLGTSGNVEGIFLIPFHLLKNIIDVENNAFTICEVALVEDIVLVTFQNGDFFNLGKTIPEGDFPKLPKFAKNNLINVGADFLKAFKMASASVLKSDDGSILSNILLDFNQKDELKIVSTDRFAVFTYVVFFEGELERPIQLLLLPAAAKIFDDVEDKLQISFNKNHVFFQHKEMVVSSKLSEGKYVDYKSVMPSKNATLTVEINALKLAVNKALVMTNEDYVGIDFIVNEKKLELKTEADNCKINIDCSTTNNTQVRISGKLLKRTLSQVNENNGELLLSITEESKPVGIQHSENNNIHLLVMPIFKNK